MSKLFTRASVAGASLTGANLKATLLSLVDALNSIGVTESARTTITASATLVTTQCGVLLVDCSSASVVLTLPTSGTSSDEAEYRIRRIDSTYTNALTVQRGSTDTIEGGATAFSVGCGGEMEFKLPGGSTNWRVTGRGGATAQAAREALGVPALNWLDNPDGEIYQRVVAATADDTYIEDRWYALTQTGTITPSQQASPEDGFAWSARIQQTQATAQRMGSAQILEGARTKKLRGKTMTFGGRYKMSASGNVRLAILAWTGTADTVTSDVVNDWTSGIYASGNFFASTSLTVVATTSTALTAATAGSASVTGTIPSNATNVIVMEWTEATQAQNVTLDRWGRRLVEGASLVDYLRRSEQHELTNCQRFYSVSNPANPKGATIGGASGVATLNNILISTYRFPVPMRAIPTMTLWNNGVQNQLRNTNTGATVAGTPSNFGATTQGSAFITVTTTPFTAGIGYDFDLLCDAEL